MDPKQHWDQVYRDKTAEQVSWYQAQPSRSLRLIEACDLPHDAALLDVGGGASMLVDHLLGCGYRTLTVLDISAAALRAARTRLGANAKQVQWVESAIGDYKPAHPFDLWHDRAVFHFLTEPSDRRRYREVLHHSLRPGGHLIMASFAKGGPRKCSGLDIVQYDADALTAELGQEFRLIEQDHEVHRTPSGTEQDFAYFHFIRKSVNE